MLKSPHGVHRVLDVLSLTTLLCWSGSLACRRTDTPIAKGSTVSTESPCPHAAAWESEPIDKGQFLRRSKSNGKHAGFSRVGKNHLYLTMGIEQWDEGKRATHRRQIWQLMCNDPSGIPGGARVYCSVERTVIESGSGAFKPSVSTWRHNLQDGTLRLKRLDWDEGVFDFAVVFTDGETADASLRFRRDGENYSLSSFRAMTVHRDSFTGELSVMDYRPTDYTYVVNVPIEVPGLSDAGLKQWDTLFASLPEKDQGAWREMDKLMEKVNLEEPIRRELKIRFPDIDMKKVDAGEIKLSEEQERVMQTVVSKALAEVLTEALDKTSLSPLSKERITTHIRTHMAKSLICEHLAHTMAREANFNRVPTKIPTIEGTDSSIIVSY